MLPLYSRQLSSSIPQGGNLFSPYALWGISALEVTLRF
jgi:hypothetical protein